jgi:hypothetical protein
VLTKSVLKINVGDKLSLASEDFARLSAAFLAETERKFVAV